MIINGHPCAPNHTLESLCHFGDGKISDGKCAQCVVRV
jgi:hypothetical protein